MSQNSGGGFWVFFILALAVFFTQKNIASWVGSFLGKLFGWGRNPLGEAWEAGERMRQGDDAFSTLSETWAKLCRSHGAQPEAAPSDNRALDYDREQLIYAACAVWRDPYVIDAVAQRLPGLFKNWQPSVI